MPNLVVTNACNLRCPFCFATEYRADQAVQDVVHVGVEEFQEQLRFLDTDRVRFCGGEPTLHPRFDHLLHLALEEPSRRVLLMTNGLWPDAVRTQVERLPRRERNRISYLVNVLEPALYAPGQVERLHATLAVLDRHGVTLGFTLYKAPYDFSFVLALAKRYRIDNIRTSVAAPNVTDPRSWNVEPARDFPALAQELLRLARDVRAARRRLQSDCGYIPPCFFTDAEREELGKLQPDAVRTHCHGPVDLGPGGGAWRCYGLYAVLRADRADYGSGQELAEDFERRTELLQDHLLLERCGECSWRAQGTCGGGCFAFRVTRALRDKAAGMGISLEDGPALDAAVPVVLERQVHPRRVSGRDLLMLRVQGDWTPWSTTAEEQRILSACDGRRRVDQVAQAVGLDVQVVRRAVRRFLEQGAITFKPGDIVLP